ncbi:MAG: acetylornithine transaminase [Actinomycetota bacterium]|nr:acetylornithine transaminase [Actinomycetota bacterium]
MTHAQDVLDRYRAALIPVFGIPQTVLSHGDGCYVVDVDGKRYLDLLGGIAVNTLGHGHPALLEAIAKQSSQLMHISNFFTSEPQVELAEKLLEICRAPAGSGVFLCNSGAEAVEAAIKLTRRTGRSRIIAAKNAFHGRTTGALALTWKEAYRAPFEPLLPGVSHVAYNDPDALRAEVADAGDDLAAVILEPLQGEAGVIAADPAYLRLARDLTAQAGALLVLDEIQTGMGRTGHWLAHHATDVVPDAVTLAKGLAGGVPVGALVTYGADVTALLSGGQHGSTFGGNPLASAAGVATIRTIESDGLLAHADQIGDHLRAHVVGLGHPRVAGTRGQGLLIAVQLTEPVAVSLMSLLREAGFLVNAVAPDALRLAPPLILTQAEADSFVAVLPDLLDAAVPA